MIVNKELYPDNYFSIDTIEIQSELEYLNIGLLLGVLKQLLAIRNAGQMSVRNQTRLVGSEVGKMRAELTGANIFITTDEMGNSSLSVGDSKIPADLKGNTGYIFGGDRRSMLGVNEKEKNTIEKIFFIGEVIQLTANNLSEPKQWFGIGGDTGNGWLFGSWNTSNSKVYNCVERINYADEVIFRVDNTLSEPKHSIGVTNNRAFAYLMGGGNGKWNRIDPDYPYSKKIEKLTFITGSSNLIAITLNESRSCSPNIKGNRNNAWIFGGIGREWEVLNTVEKFNFADEAITPMANMTGHNLTGHSNIGNERYIYLCGGKDNGRGRWKEGESVITKFDMESFSVERMGVKLVEARTASSATNSNQFGYILGGWGLSNNVIPTQTIEKLMPLGQGEKITRVGIQLQFPRSEGGAISNYGETFYGA